MLRQQGGKILTVFDKYDFKEVIIYRRTDSETERNYCGVIHNIDVIIPIEKTMFEEIIDDVKHGRIICDITHSFHKHDGSNIDGNPNFVFHNFKKDDQ